MTKSFPTPRAAVDYILDTFPIVKRKDEAKWGDCRTQRVILAGGFTTKMGRYDFSSWTIHMAFIIVFSNLWGLFFKEWKDTSRRTHRIIFAGLLVIIGSTLVIGLGNYVAALKR